MPKKFTQCQQNGGKIRTVKPNASTYIPVCIPKGGGASVRGEVHKVKKGK